MSPRKAIPPPENWEELHEQAAHQREADPVPAPERPDVPPPVTKKYRVTGPQLVFDTARGEVFERVLTVEQEDHLIQAGHIVPVEESPAVPAVEKEKDHG